MTSYMKLVRKPHPSNKERLITSEIERRGHTLSYVLEPYFEVLPKIMDMFPDKPLVAWVGNPPLACTGDNRVVMFNDNIKRYMKENAEENMMKITYVEVLVHELSHVICDSRIAKIAKRYKRNLVKLHPVMYGAHGALFRDTYTKMCHKYKIRYPDDRYFIDPE